VNPPRDVGAPIDAFLATYNQHRPPRSLPQRATPATADTARTNPGPGGRLCSIGVGRTTPDPASSCSPRTSNPTGAEKQKPLSPGSWVQGFPALPEWDYGRWVVRPAGSASLGVLSGRSLGKGGVIVSVDHDGRSHVLPGE
jgi:hypothetical protein